MALNYGPQELDRYIPGLAQDFNKFADDNFICLDKISNYQKLAIAEKRFSIELTKESLELFVRLTDEYIKRQN